MKSLLITLLIFNSKLKFEDQFLIISFWIQKKDQKWFGVAIVWAKTMIHSFYKIIANQNSGIPFSILQQMIEKRKKSVLVFVLGARNEIFILNLKIKIKNWSSNLNFKRKTEKRNTTFWISYNPSPPPLPPHHTVPDVWARFSSNRHFQTDI